jgi:hypothetical protein
VRRRRDPCDSGSGRARHRAFGGEASVASGLHVEAAPGGEVRLPGVQDPDLAIQDPRQDPIEEGCRPPARKGGSARGAARPPTEGCGQGRIGEAPGEARSPAEGRRRGRRGEAVQFFFLGRDTAGYTPRPNGCPLFFEEKRMQYLCPFCYLISRI